MLEDSRATMRVPKSLQSYGDGMQACGWTCAYVQAASLFNHSRLLGLAHTSMGPPCFLHTLRLSSSFAVGYESPRGAGQLGAAFIEHVILGRPQLWVVQKLFKTRGFLVALVGYRLLGCRLMGSYVRVLLRM